MKKILSVIVIILCFTCNTSLNAQDTTVYKSVFGTDSTYLSFIVEWMYANCIGTYMITREDTVINEQSWKKTVIFDETYIGPLPDSLFPWDYRPIDTLFHREDTVNGRLWLLNMDGTETLLQDMTLTEGDTFLRQDTYFYDPDGTKFVVTDISFDSNGKNITLVGPTGIRSTIKMIEGIGCTDWFVFGSRKRPRDFNYYDIVCQKKDTLLDYFRPNICGKCLCDRVIISIHDNDSKNQMSLFPNPTDDFICLDGDLPFVDYMEIIGLDGVILMRAKSRCINVSTLPKGLYLLRYRDGETLLQKKFIKK